MGRLKKFFANLFARTARKRQRLSAITQYPKADRMHNLYVDMAKSKGFKPSNLGEALACLGFSRRKAYKIFFRFYRASGLNIKMASNATEQALTKHFDPHAKK